MAGTAFVAAFALSPRGYRHPYLLYTALLAAGARLTDYLAPALLGSPSPSPSPSAAQLKTAAAAARARRDRKRMDASYEDLGRDNDDDHEAAASPTSSTADLDEESVNGEDVRAALAAFTKAHVAQSAVAALGFMMAVVGLWGDGVDKIVSAEAVLVQI